MGRFATDGTLGVGSTFLIMGAVYLLFMLFGAFLIRVPADGWTPPAGRRNPSRAA